MSDLLRIILARVLYMWGSLHRNFGNKSSFLREHRYAVRRFTQAYDLDPTLRVARLDRGILYYREMGMLDEALADFDALLVEDPSYGPALLNRAMVVQQQGRYAAALADLDAYLLLPIKDQEYWHIASRTATLLRGLLADMPNEVSGE
jgi:tetratricopeptide (TPR) repeat protein